jgi:hypothetical protein
MWMGWFGWGAYLGGPMRALEGCMMDVEPTRQLDTCYVAQEYATVRTCDVWWAMALDGLSW